MAAEHCLTFGRGADADVTIQDDEYLSPVHCRVSFREGRWWVEDLGSTNGTRVLRRGLLVKVEPFRVRLEAGDRVRIGRTLLPWVVPA